MSKHPLESELDTTESNYEQQLAENKALRAEVARLREALTPSAETKFAYIGEFKFSIPITLEDGEEGSQPVVVPWTTVKEIMAAILTRSALRSKED